MEPLATPPNSAAPSGQAGEDHSALGLAAPASCKGLPDTPDLFMRGGRRPLSASTTDTVTPQPAKAAPQAGDPPSCGSNRFIGLSVLSCRLVCWPWDDENVSESWYTKRRCSCAAVFPCHPGQMQSVQQELHVAVQWKKPLCILTRTCCAHCACSIDTMALGIWQAIIWRSSLPIQCPRCQSPLRSCKHPGT